MEEHPNVTRTREVYAGLTAGNMEMMLDAIADDVVWHQIGGPSLQGKQALIESMSGMEGVDLSLDVHDVVGNDEHVVGLVTATVRMGSDSFTYRTAEIMHFDADGKATERWAFSDDTEAIVDFFGSSE